MVAKLIISPLLDERIAFIEKELAVHKTSLNHHDIFLISDDEKVGVEQTKKVREHLTTKAYSAPIRGVVIISAHKMSTDAQNSLLKTLEEPAKQTLILMGSKSEEDILPTVRSRCQIIYIGNISTASSYEDIKEKVESVLQKSLEDRYKYVEKLDDKDKFLQDLITYYRKQLTHNPQNLPIMQELMQAEIYKNANVNMRAILEYLMLVIPSPTLAPKGL